MHQQLCLLCLPCCVYIFKNKNKAEQGKISFNKLEELCVKDLVF